MIGRRRVEQRERDAGDDLHAEAEQQQAAEREPPARAGRQRLVERVTAEGAEARAVVEPVGDRRGQALHSSTSISEVCGLTRTLTRVSGAGGGPETTLPFTVVDAAVARTLELLATRVPVHAAAEMRAGRRQRAVAVAVASMKTTDCLRVSIPAVRVAFGEDGRERRIRRQIEDRARLAASAARDAGAARRGHQADETGQRRRSIKPTPAIDELRECATTVFEM